MNSFADDAKYDISNVPGAQITEDYESKRTDAWSVIENLGIIKRIVSVCRYLSTFWLSKLFMAALRQREWYKLLGRRLAKRIWDASRLWQRHRLALPV